MRACAVIGVCVFLAGCGGSQAEPELTSAPAQASSRANCVALDTTFRSTFSAPVYTRCGVTREARLSGRPPRPDYDVPRSGASCYRAIIEVVVDERGTPQPETARIVRTTDTRFARAIVDALRSRKYTPASLNGTPVAQVVEVDESIQLRVVVVRSSTPGPPPGPPPRGMGSGPSC